MQPIEQEKSQFLVYLRKRSNGASHLTAPNCNNLRFENVVNYTECQYSYSNLVRRFLWCKQRQILNDCARIMATAKVQMRPSFFWYVT